MNHPLLAQSDSIPVVVLAIFVVLVFACFVEAAFGKRAADRRRLAQIGAGVDKPAPVPDDATAEAIRIALMILSAPDVVMETKDMRGAKYGSSWIRVYSSKAFTDWNVSRVFGDWCGFYKVERIEDPKVSHAIPSEFEWALRPGFDAFDATTARKQKETLGAQAAAFVAESRKVLSPS